MSVEKLAGEDLVAMQKEKGNICVSVIIPSHRLSPDRRVDSIEAEKAIDKAVQLLQYKYGKRDVESVIKKLWKLYEVIDFTHNLDGIGLYVSPHIGLTVKFPFAVEEKIIVGDRFELRDLLYKINYDISYYVMMLTEKKIRLFKGSWDKIIEVEDKNFPAEYYDDFAYAKPAHSTQYAGYAHVKGFEKDKSEMDIIRHKDFFRTTDKLLRDYLFSDTPLLLTGVEKELAWFAGVTNHTGNIAGKISHNFDYSVEKELADNAWSAMHSYLKNKRTNLVKELAEKIGEGHGVTGIRDVWNATQEGRAFKLLVEKDYRIPGFLSEDEFHLYLLPPRLPHKTLSDAIDYLIETVLEKGGQVFFVDNGLLKDYDRIALITRY